MLTNGAAYIESTVGREANPGRGWQRRAEGKSKAREGEVFDMLDIAVALAFAGMVLLPALVAMGSSSAEDEANVQN